MLSVRLKCVAVTFSLLLLAVLTQAQAATPLPGPPHNRLSSPRNLPADNAQTQNAESSEASSGYSVLYNFCSVGGDDCTDGSLPWAGMIQDAEGNLYGTASSGGLYDGGTVFELDPATKVETVLYKFGTEAGDGAVPLAGLIRDAEGNLYGTTTGAGGNLAGTVFMLDSKNNETVLYNFCTTVVSEVCTDGQLTDAGLVQDTAGNLYGTTYNGGVHNYGTVFKVDPATKVETVLYSFCSVGGTKCTDGAWPAASLIRDTAGNLYGTTSYGGTDNGGTVFKLDTEGQLTVLYRFCSAVDCTDGNGPSAPLIRDAAGNLYGTTSAGGANNGGTVFKLDTTGHETVLYSFCSACGKCTDGEYPNAVIADANGNFYGTTGSGGANNKGTVFELDATGNQRVLYSFCSVVASGGNCNDGESPEAGLTRDAEGNLYGTTSDGGVSNYFGLGYGTAFRVSPPPTQTAQTITFPNPGTQTYGAVVTLKATATSGLPVTYQVISGQGKVSCDTLTVTGVESITVQARQGGDYSYAAAKPVSVTFTVDKAVLTVKATNVSRAYGALNPALSYTIEGYKNGDTGKAVTGTATLTTTATTKSAVGTYPITFSTKSLTAANYTFTYDAATLTVSKAVLTVKATNASRAYGAANPIFHYTTTGFVNGDKSTVVTGKATPTTTATTKSPVGTYPITFSTETLTATNYSFTYVNGEISVGKAELTVTATSLSKVAGTANPTLTYTIAGFQNGDTSKVVSGKATLTTTATTKSAVGKYPITFSTESLTAANYAFTYVNGTLTVNPPPPTITALSPNSATAGGAAFTLTITGTNFVSGAAAKWDTTALTTTYVSATKLTAAVPKTLIATAGTAKVTVTTTGGTSAAATFTIR